MFKWWKRKKPKNTSMNSLSDDDNNKKKTRSLVSFFLDHPKTDAQQISDQTIKDNSVFQNPSNDINLRDSALIYHPGSKQWSTTQYSNIKSPAQLRIQPDNHFHDYLQLFDELITENTSCFGFSLSQISSKHCLYMSIIIFLGICLIISFTALLKK
jgi:hypothetical protein